MKDQKRKLAVIIFTDIVGYSKLSHKNEVLALRLLDEHRDILRPIIAQYSGIEIKTIGDAFLLQFSNAFDAVRCALHMQRALEKRNAVEDRSRVIQLRIGIHLGDVIEGDDGDIYGDGVNIAARVVQIANAGEICVSTPVYHQIRNKAHLKAELLGQRQLKNISEKYKIYRISYKTAETFWEYGNEQLRSFRRFFLRVLPHTALLVCLLTIFLYNTHSSKDHTNTQVDPRRVALLPFKSEGLDEGETYLPEGLTSELISTLSKVRGIRILAESTVASYQNSQKSPSEIGAELGVGVLLESSIRKVDGHLHFSSQLIDTKTEEYLWSQDYEGSLDDVMQIQKRIAHGIADKLEGRTLASVEMPEVDVNSNAAYVNYLKGKYFFGRRGEEDLRLAEQYFEQATRLDPKFGLAYNSLANVFDILAFYGYMSPAEAYSKGMAAAEIGLTLEPDSAVGHLFLGEKLEAMDHDWATAEMHFKRAIELRPDMATAHSWYADLLISFGEFDAAKVEMTKAKELEPKSPIITVAFGRPDYYARRYSEAVTAYESAVDMDSTYRTSFFWLGAAYLELGRTEDAIRVLEHSIQLSPTQPMMVQAMLACAYAKGGRVAEARKLYEEMKRLRKTKFVSAYFLAEVSVALGQPGDAIHHLKIAQKEHANHLMFLGVDPRFDDLHKNKAFIAMVNEIGSVNYRK